MFWKKKSKKVEETDAEKTLTYLFGVLDGMDPKDAQYAEILEHIGKVHKLVECEKSPERERVRPEVWVSAGASVFMLLATLGYEHVHPITSKAFSTIQRPKI